MNIEYILLSLLILATGVGMLIKWAGNGIGRPKN